MKKLSQFWDKVNIKLREKSNPYLGPLRRKALRRSDFTIISNNCWGGAVCRYYSVGYNSPTVGMYFFADDYIKFVKNLKHYINSPLEIIQWQDSKWAEQLKNKDERSRKCPIGRLDDVEIVFLHYKSPEEAMTKWNRRKERIVWDNIFFKMSEMNGCTVENMKEFDELDTANKFIFVTKDYGLKSQIVFKNAKLSDDGISDDTTHFRKFINLTKWLNGERKFAKHQ